MSLPGPGRLAGRAIVLLAVLAVVSTPARAVQWMGVNLAGAEFEGQSFWPVPAEADYFRAAGMNVVRIPFRWERLQPVLSAPLDAAQLAALTAVVDDAIAAGHHVILDPHNYARYGGQVIGSAAVPLEAFTDFWRRLATQFGDRPQVIFGLMNEPHSMPTEAWLDAANAGIAGIRAAGAAQWILVPGNAWTGAHSWLSDWYGTPNGTVMLGVVDPLDHYVFELHQYFDGDYSGTSPTCREDAGAAQFAAVTGWLRAHGRRGVLGEFAGADNEACRRAVRSALDHLDANADVWLGWTWWAAGPVWGDYMFTLEPTGNFSVDRPQMAWLRPHLDRLFASGFD